ncbi:unnamed protein product [Allacma fusca]|uniref:Uncharacterized protein n=1 Tax=Allacma fusca TaxID=39272 RepID=A0A8J2KQ22_9HEXA|nr:unnamed protein product [Allacma fusca]
MALKFYEGNCDEFGDYLTIYQRSSEGWTKNGLQAVAQFCNSSSTELPLWTFSCEVIITFQTSAAGGSNNGFQLIWVPSKS